MLCMLRAAGGGVLECPSAGNLLLVMSDGKFGGNSGSTPSLHCGSLAGDCYVATEIPVDFGGTLLLGIFKKKGAQ
jgi:hypothetical protein